MSPAMPGLAFARTDVGGAYRFDPANGRWWPITDWVGHDELEPHRDREHRPRSGRPQPRLHRRRRVPHRRRRRHPQLDRHGADLDDQQHPGRRWAATSTGARWASGWRSIPTCRARSTSGRATPASGQSTDSAADLDAVASFPTSGATSGGAGSGNASGSGYGLTFVLFDPKSGPSGSPTPTIYVGVGVTTGTALYRSTDAGATWAAVGGQPSGDDAPPRGARRLRQRLLHLQQRVGPQRRHGGRGLAVHAGDRRLDRREPGTRRVRLRRDRRRRRPTRDARSSRPSTTGRRARSIGPPTAARAGCRWSSADSWDVATAQWLYWHTSSLPAMGWMGDVEIDPFDSSHALFITGQGLWSSDDVTHGRQRRGDALDVRGRAGSRRRWCSIWPARPARARLL